MYSQVCRKEILGAGLLFIQDLNCTYPKLGDGQAPAVQTHLTPDTACSHTSPLGGAIEHYTPKQADLQFVSTGDHSDEHLVTQCQ